MPRGGRRFPPGGRPKGSKDTKPRAIHRKNMLEGNMSEKAAFLDFCRTVATSGRASQILDEALRSEDRAERFRAMQLCVEYSVGRPAVNLKVEASVEDVLREIHEERELRQLEAESEEKKNESQ